MLSYNLVLVCSWHHVMQMVNGHLYREPTVYINISKMTVLIKHVVLVIIELPSLLIIRKQVTSILLQSITDNSFSRILYL